MMQLLHLDPTKRSVYFITDIGEDLIASASDGTELPLPRYGVWRRDVGVVEAGEDIAFLQEKYNVPNSQVHVL